MNRRVFDGKELNNNKNKTLYCIYIFQRRLTATGINATTATAMRQIILSGVKIWSSSEDDNRSSAAPACTWIKDGPATPIVAKFF